MYVIVDVTSTKNQNHLKNPYRLNDLKCGGWSPLRKPPVPHQGLGYQVILIDDIVTR